MANITKYGDERCYSCGKQCVNVEFCSEGASYSAEEVKGLSLSRNLKVKIIANPAYWGFGTLEENVLISGWATFNNGYYDFWDGHDEDHSATKTCLGTTYGPFLNEQRPDVFYRSVYDPDTGLTTNYSSDGQTLEDKTRGGAEVYLIDKPKGLIDAVTADNPSCDTTSPTQVFKQLPENYGWGNKIHFKNKIYKNQTGAWRLTSLENCYSESDLYTPSGFLGQCDTSSKQNISNKKNQYQNYDISRIRVSGVSGCTPDGVSASEYQGDFFAASSIYRDTGVSPFLQARLTYNNGPASGIRNGIAIGIDNDVDLNYNNIYFLFDVNHQASYTEAKFVGSFDSENSLSVDIGSSGSWVALGSYDPNTCCGLAAYGVDDDTKSINGENYHSDFRRIFNNPKNIRQSNRDSEWRNTYGLGEIGILATGLRVDHSYVSVDESGMAVLSLGSGLEKSGYPIYEKELSYYGRFYQTDVCDSGIRSDQQTNRTTNKNATCYSKHATLEIFPDCLTQWDDYLECQTEIQRYNINRTPRLAFVYRGCEFDTNCDFDEQGRPLGLWENQGGVPTGINDLKRGLAGQEIHMYINLGWSHVGSTQQCQCDCNDPDVPGQLPWEHVIVPSPVSFPSLPNFDLYPEEYGCLDPRFQLTQYRKWITGNGSSPGAPPPSGRCDALPFLPEACNVRQPYTTYGYIMNLCGKQSQNRKNVIKSAFAKLNQDKTYTHLHPEIDIEEPMYWEVECPAPSPFSIGSPSPWSSGTSNDDKVLNIEGSGYGYWGLVDQNNRLVAPYFKTKAGYLGCCEQETSPGFIDFDPSGTFYDGWPTDSVPFLIELEVDDSCLGCATINMSTDPLYLDIDSLPTKYIHNQNGAYGFNHCRYGNRIVTYEPSYTCESGFNPNYPCPVAENGYAALLGNRYTGETCGCLEEWGGVQLNPVFISGTNLVKGFISGSTSNPVVKIETCGDNSSTIMDVGAEDSINSPGGYSIYGIFTLACPGFDSYLYDPVFPRAAYEQDIVSSLWGEATSCAQHYPARIGDDLELKATFYLIHNFYTELFESLPLDVIDRLNFEDPLVFSGDSNTFGLCPGDKVTTYGCFVEGDLYGCHGGGYSPTPICEGNTLCNTCPIGDGEGEISCYCDSQVGYEGIEPRRPPTNYSLNECYCDCKDPYPIAEYYLDDDLALVLVSGSGYECADVYWMSASGANINTGPLLLFQGPPAAYIGLNLGSYTANDWFEFSHGVNAESTGIFYKINPPVGTDSQIGATCAGLSIKTCDLSDCANDSKVGSSSCGNPIYNSGTAVPVVVNRKKCDPEIAIVTKISCLAGSGKPISSDPEDGRYDAYKLTISREYHEHDRTWYERISDGPGSTPRCAPKQYGSYRYDNGLGDTGCLVMPYAVPADNVTPAYQGPCHINPSSGTYVTQDYQFTNKPFASGDTLWNYYNLFYDSGFPNTSVSGISSYGTYVPAIYRDNDGVYDCSTDGTIYISGTIFDTGNFIEPTGFFGTLETNRKHSCIQDVAECGGELWCSKMFFPRHPYASGTKVSYFGAPSICLQNNEFYNAYGTEGWEELADDDLLKEMKFRYVNWCADSAKSEILYNVGIDDVEIVVEDYLPLMGISHPGWRYTLDTKSCTVFGTGCIGPLVPTHEDYTIRIGTHAPKTLTQNKFDAMGYYLDKINASGSDECLINPFKIMLDVECSTNTIKRKNIPDHPTSLTAYMNISPRVCKGHIGDVPCTCADSLCRYNLVERKGQCVEFALAEYKATLSSGIIFLDDYCASSDFKTFLVNEQAYGAYLQLDLLEDIPVLDGKSVPIYCGNRLVSAGDGWMKSCSDNTCYRIGSTRKLSHLWECNEYAYISPNPQDGYDTVCECESDYQNGICSSTSRALIPYNSCDNLIVDDWDTVPSGSGGTLSATGWWVTDCECEINSYNETACSTNSLIKLTITEAGLNPVAKTISYFNPSSRSFSSNLTISGERNTQYNDSSSSSYADQIVITVNSGSQPYEEGAESIGYAQADDNGAGTNTDIFVGSSLSMGRDEAPTIPDISPVLRNGLIRFPEAGIPKDSTITSATLTVKVSSGPAASKTLTMRWFGDKSTSPSDPADYTAHAALSRTTAYLDKTYTSTTGNYTHDVTSIIQELVSESGWTTSSKVQLLADYNSKTGTGFPQQWIATCSSTLADHTLLIEYT